MAPKCLTRQVSVLWYAIKQHEFLADATSLASGVVPVFEIAFASMLLTNSKMIGMADLMLVRRGITGIAQNIVYTECCWYRTGT